MRKLAKQLQIDVNRCKKLQPNEIRRNISVVLTIRLGTALPCATLDVINNMK